MSFKYVLENHMLLVALIIFVVIYIIVNINLFKSKNVSIFEGNYKIPIVYAIIISLLLYIFICDGKTGNTYRLVKAQDAQPYYEQFRHQAKFNNKITNPDINNIANIKSLLKSDSIFLKSNLPQQKHSFGLRL
jgi:hypothetical protein